MDKWVKLALAGVLLLTVILGYNVVMVMHGQEPPFTPWDELQTLAALALGYVARALK